MWVLTYTRSKVLLKDLESKVCCDFWLLDGSKDTPWRAPLGSVTFHIICFLQHWVPPAPSLLYSLSSLIMPFSPPWPSPSLLHGTLSPGFPASVAFHSSQPPLASEAHHVWWSSLLGSTKLWSMHLQVSLPLAHLPNPETRETLPSVPHRPPGPWRNHTAMSSWLPLRSQHWGQRSHSEKHELSELEGLPPRKAPAPQYSWQLAARLLREHILKRKPERAELSPGWPPSEAGVDPHRYLLPVGVPSRTLIPVIAMALPCPWGTV